MENRIKDCQLDFFANRMSAHAYKANQLRLLLAAFRLCPHRRYPPRRPEKDDPGQGRPQYHPPETSESRRQSHQLRATHQALPARCLSLTKTCSSRPTLPWRPHDRNSPPQQGKGGNAAAAMTPACPKPTKNQIIRRACPTIPARISISKPEPPRRHSNQPDHSQMQRLKNAS